MKPKSVLLLGSYGQTNIGDDLLMWNYLQMLKDRGFSDIYVNANTKKNIPTPVLAAFPDLKVLETYGTSLLEYGRCIRRVDVLVYGGGTLYKELYASTGRSPRSVIIRLMTLNLLARILGTPVYHLNIGIGSLKTWRGRMISKIALAVVSQSVFRDQTSYDYAKEVIHIREAKIMKATDGIFLNRVWENPWKKKKLPGKGEVIGVNVLSDIPDWVDREKYIQQLRRFVEMMLKGNKTIVFFPFQHDFNLSNDKVFIKEVFGDAIDGKRCVLLNDIPIDLVTDYMQQCSVFVGMRLHSLLLATVARVPFVGIAYDTKCLRFLKESRYPHFVELEKIDADELYRKTLGVQKQREDIIHDLSAIAEDNFNEAEEALRKLPF